MRFEAFLLLLIGPCASGAAAGEEIAFENARLRLELGADAVWRRVTDKVARRELLPAGAKVPLADAQIGGRQHAATSAAVDGERLTVGFAGGTRLSFLVTTRPDWVALRLVEVAGPRPQRLRLLRLPVAIAERVGSRLNGAWDARSAVCVRGLNLQTHGRPTRRGAWTELTAETQDEPGPKLEGSAAAVVVCPPGEMSSLLDRLAAECGLPRNADPNTHRPSRDLPAARQSYWFLRFGAKDVPRVIDLCRRTHIRQVMMMSHSWCRSVGHYTFRTDQYPGGVEDLRRAVAALHAEGILVGMHCFASKVSKTDAYVTPVPDRRFWTDRTAALAADVAPGDTEIHTASDLREWPGSPVASQTTWEGGVAKHREVIFDDEIVQYESIGPAGRWDTFLGCRRGAWGTKAAAHKAPATGRHYGVDGCIDGYIVDQETDLLDETTSRLAEVFNQCGFDMVYFDGGEDVDRRRFGYYVSKFQAVAMGKFRRRPLIHMGTIMTHELWGSFTRSGTVDTYLNTLYGRILSGAKVESWPTVREHIDRSVEYMLRIGDDMLPGELGWFGIWPRGKNTDGLQLDEVEYLLCKSLAHDAPISLETSLAQMDSHPLTPGVLEIVGAYEQLRRAGTVPPAERKRLAEAGRDFLLLRCGPDAEPELLAASPLESVAGGREVRGLIAPAGKGTVAALWHWTGQQGALLLPAGARGVRAVDVAGRPVPLPQADGGPEVPLGPRRVALIFDRLGVEEARKLLAGSSLAARQPAAPRD